MTIRYTDATSVDACKGVRLATADRALWKGVPCGNYCLLPGRLTGTAKRGER